MNKSFLKKVAGTFTLTALTATSICPVFANVIYPRNPKDIRVIVIDDGSGRIIVSDREDDREKIPYDYNAYYMERINKIINSLNEKISNKLIHKDIAVQDSDNGDTDVKSENNNGNSTDKEQTTDNDISLKQSYSEYITKVVDLTNEQRAKYKLPPLKLSDALCKSAQDHADDMYENNYFDHTSLNGATMSDRIEKYSSSYGYKGENIAWGYSTPEAAVDGWMNSEGHRANILNENYTDIGVGYNNGYWVQNFGG